MLAVESDGRGVVLTEQVVGIDGGVLVAEEAPDACLLLFGDALEALLRHLLVLLDEGLGHDEVLHAVLPWVGEVLCPYHAVLLHGVAHL